MSLRVSLLLENVAKVKKIDKFCSQATPVKASKKGHKGPIWGGHPNDTMTKLKINQLLMQECKLALDRIGSAQFRGFQSILHPLHPFHTKVASSSSPCSSSPSSFFLKESRPWVLQRRKCISRYRLVAAATSSIIHQTLPMANVQWAMLGSAGSNWIRYRRLGAHSVN